MFGLACCFEGAGCGSRAEVESTVGAFLVVVLKGLEVCFKTAYVLCKGACLQCCCNVEASRAIATPR